MLTALDRPEAAIRCLVLLIVGRHGLRAEQALPILRKALVDTDRDVRQEATTALILVGSHICSEEAERLEARIATSPDDLATRGLLLGYYFLRQYIFDAERPIRQRHAIWVITHAPESDFAGDLCELNAVLDEEAYTEAKTIWLRHVESGSPNSTVIGNAASFFAVEDENLCERLLRHGQTIEPIVWAEGDTVRIWWDASPEIEQRESLGDEALDGVACYRLMGQFPGLSEEQEEKRRQEFLRLTGKPLLRGEASPLLVWIDRGTFLIRRIAGGYRHDTFRTEHITTHEPANGAPIAEDELRFDPPEQQVK